MMNGASNKKSNRFRRRTGLSIVELLLALSITAILLTATAAAFNAAFSNYKVNNELTTASMSSRNAVYQMCSTIRSAYNDPDDPNAAVIEVSSDGTECSMVNADGRDTAYRYSNTVRKLQISIDGSQWYTMVENVDPVDNATPIFAAFDDPQFSPGTVGKIEICFKVTINGLANPISASAVPRNVIYN